MQSTGGCYTLLASVLQPDVDIVIVLVRLSWSVRLNWGERRRSRRRLSVLGGAAPPIIKLVCCVEGPCLRGRQGSFLHSVDSSSERGEGSSELSHSPSLSCCFCNSSVAALRLGDLHSRADWRPPVVWGSSYSSSSSSLTLCQRRRPARTRTSVSAAAVSSTAIMCDCFHLAFPNWHAASSGTGGHHTLISLFALLCAVSLAQQQGSVVQCAAGEITFCACVCFSDGESERQAAGADAELCCWPAVSAGCVCRVKRRGGGCLKMSSWQDVRRLCASSCFPSCYVLMWRLRVEQTLLLRFIKSTE